MKTRIKKYFNTLTQNKVSNSLIFLKHASDKKRVSIIMCGDFNSVPECGIYRLMTTGQVSQDCVDFRSSKQIFLKK